MLLCCWAKGYQEPLGHSRHGPASHCSLFCLVGSAGGLWADSGYVRLTPGSFLRVVEDNRDVDDKSVAVPEIRVTDLRKTAGIVQIKNGPRSWRRPLQQLMGLGKSS